jgi:hypothetical protein
MDETIYNLTRDGLLQKRESLHALPANAVEAESWARNFSDSLVRFFLYYSIALDRMNTFARRMCWSFSVATHQTGDSGI